MPHAEPDQFLPKYDEENPAYCYTNKASQQGGEKVLDEENDNAVVSFEPSRKIFLADHGISFRISGVTRENGFIHNVTYKIEVRHAGYYWTIFRDYQQIHAIFLNLYFLDIANGPKNAVTDGSFSGVIPDGTHGDFPAVPARLRPKAAPDEEPAHFRAMEDAMAKLFGDRERREHSSSCRFLETSKFSFHGVGSDEEKVSEIYLERLFCRLHDYLNVPCNHNNAGCQLFSQWKSRWVVILETCYFYFNLKSGELSCLFLFDQFCKVERVPRRPLALLVKHAMKDLVLRFSTKIELEDWIIHWEKTSQTTALDFTGKHPHTSFAPVRHNIPVRWFINGAPYMSAVAEALEAATEEIFIGGWWVSPEVFLKRPPEGNKHWRLDYILKRKADAGVKIYILVYKESKIALGINSWYSKKKLMKMSPNIIVKRHPDNNVVLWSHHDKLVVVDQKLAFVGGIDLCYGRWDTHLHKFSDLTPEMLEEYEQKKEKKEAEGHKCNLLRNRHFPHPEMTPKHHKRKTVQLVLQSPWNFAKATMYHPRHKPSSRWGHNMRKYKKSMKAYTDKGPFRIPSKSNLVRAASLEDNLDGVSNAMLGCTWMGKDYINEVKVAFSQPNDGKPYEDVLDRTECPRLPWHDAGAAFGGPAAQDLARHFIQKWNTCKMQKFRFDEQGPYLIPKRYNQDVYDDLPWESQNCDVQVIRNTASWSSGLLPHVVETSIQQTYIDLILNAKHFVYLESQFFITLVGSKKNVKNAVGDAIYHRILRAWREGTNFRVYIVIPLQPAIAGQYGTRSGAAVQAVTHFIYQSISRGGDSLMERLSDSGCDHRKYITFGGLRQYGMLAGKLATEIVYVHAKLMIVDDVYSIIGSANMNDRSMLGSRDSEIGIVVHDKEFEDSMMDGKPYRSGTFSGRLRRRLMQICLGLAEDMDYAVSREEADRIVQDPVCDEFYRDFWIKTAVKNEEIFLEVFAPVPNDKCFTFHELKEWEKKKPLSETDPEKAKEMLKDVRGYLTKFPLKFLKDSRLKPIILTGAGLLPYVNWT